MFIASLQSFLHLMFRDLAAVVLSEGTKARLAALIIRFSPDPYKFYLPRRPLHMFINVSPKMRTVPVRELGSQFAN